MNQTSEQLKEQYRLLQKKLQEAKEKRDNLIRRTRLAKAQQGATNSLTAMGKSDPFAKFDHMQDIVERREAEAKASYAAMTGTLSYEIDQLKKVELNSKVDDALAKLRAEVDANKKTS